MAAASDLQSAISAVWWVRELENLHGCKRQNAHHDKLLGPFHFEAKDLQSEISRFQ